MERPSVATGCFAVYVRHVSLCLISWALFLNFYLRSCCPVVMIMARWHSKPVALKQMFSSDVLRGNTVWVIIRNFWPIISVDALCTKDLFMVKASTVLFRNCILQWLICVIHMFSFQNSTGCIYNMSLSCAFVCPHMKIAFLLLPTWLLELSLLHVCFKQSHWLLFALAFYSLVFLFSISLFEIDFQGGPLCITGKEGPWLCALIERDLWPYRLCLHSCGKRALHCHPVNTMPQRWCCGNLTDAKYKCCPPYQLTFRAPNVTSPCICCNVYGPEIFCTNGAL